MGAGSRRGVKKKILFLKTKTEIETRETAVYLQTVKVTGDRLLSTHIYTDQLNVVWTSQQHVLMAFLTT